ncbi:protease PrsW [Buchananella hordeovulneris]|nr:protease PrsW [Buchananella hordeovulneris]
MTAITPTLPVPVYQGVPPEGWEKLTARYQAVVARLLARMGPLVSCWKWGARLALPLFVVALIFVPKFARAALPGIRMVIALAVFTALCRPRTISWRAVSLMLSGGVLCALGIALFSQATADLLELSVSADGPSTALAAFFEESGKLVPLLVVAVVAPGRARRFAVTDWALLGFASGAGFVLAEEGVRSLGLSPFGDLARDLAGLGYLSSFPNPFTEGSFVTLNPGWDSNYTVGHQVHTMLIAIGIGLAITWWRASQARSAGVRRWQRGIAAILPLLFWFSAVVTHFGWNASVPDISWQDHDIAGIPWFFGVVYKVGQLGNAELPLAMLTLLVAQLVDARRRQLADPLGVPPPYLHGPRATKPRPGWGWMMAFLDSVWAWLCFTWWDLRLTWQGYGRSDSRWLGRVLEGRRVSYQLRGVRADAINALLATPEPQGRQHFRHRALVFGVPALLVSVALGAWMAASIGESFQSNSLRYFAGILDKLGYFWDGLGAPGQILLTALLVTFLMAGGWSFAFAMGAAGIFTWFADHGHGLAALLRDPRTALNNYARTVTPGQFLWDVADFAMTFVPGSLLGGGLVRTADDIALSRRLWQNVEQLNSPKHWFDQHAASDAAVKAVQAELAAKIPPGYNIRSFYQANLDKTLPSLYESGVDAATIQDLTTLSNMRAHYYARRQRSAELLGELGGEQVLRHEGYQMAPAFKANPNLKTGPGKYSVDGLAVSQDGSRIMIPEFKGAGSKVDKTPRQLLYEPPAAQGTVPYVRDRMARDDRVAEFFAEHPDLWEGVKSGRVQLEKEVISTREPGNVVRSLYQGFSLTPEIIKHIDDKIAKLL